MKRFAPAAVAALVLALAAAAAWVTGGASAAAQGAAQNAAHSAAPEAVPGGISPLTTQAAAAASGPAGLISAAPAAQQGRGGPDGVSPSPIPGLVEVRRGADIVYMTRDGKYLLTGELYAVASHEDLTEVRRRELRRTLIDALPESQMVVFSPAHPKYTVTVFTDVDCVYCRALHGQIDDYNRLGIKVRYAFFPRTGPNTASWYKAEQVWCSADRRAALTRAKLGEPLSAKICPHTPVGREYALGLAIGLDGTPGVVAANGAMVGGYLPPKELLAALQQSSAIPTADPRSNN